MSRTSIFEQPKQFLVNVILSDEEFGLRKVDSNSGHRFDCTKKHLHTDEPFTIFVLVEQRLVERITGNIHHLTFVQFLDTDACSCTHVVCTVELIWGGGLAALENEEDDAARTPVIFTCIEQALARWVIREAYMSPTKIIKNKE